MGGRTANELPFAAKEQSPFGKASKASFGTPKLSASMSLGVTSIQSVIEKVPCSEKAPLSKERMKWQGKSPMVWIE